MASKQKYRKVSVGLRKIISLMETCFVENYFGKGATPTPITTTVHRSNRLTASVRFYNDCFVFSSSGFRNFAVPVFKFYPLLVEHLISQGKVKGADHISEIAYKISGSMMLGYMGVFYGLVLKVSDEPVEKPLDMSTKNPEAVEEWAVKQFESGIKYDFDAKWFRRFVDAATARDAAIYFSAASCQDAAVSEEIE